MTRVCKYAGLAETGRPLPSSGVINKGRGTAPREKPHETFYYYLNLGLNTNASFF